MNLENNYIERTREILKDYRRAVVDTGDYNHKGDYNIRTKKGGIYNLKV